MARMVRWVHSSRMPSHALIVGGAGYIGSAVTDLLARAGHDVRVYDCLLWEDEYRRPHEFIRGDIRDHERLTPHLAWADAVIWLAALVADQSCALYPDLARELNDRTVAWLAQHYDGRIIFPSTSLAYGMSDTPLTEDMPLQPQTLYQETKVAAEHHLAGHALILRLATLYGVAASNARPRFDLVPNRFTGLAVEGRPMPVRGGMQSRGFCHVRDVARVMVDHATTGVVGAYNLASENATIRALAERITTHVPAATIAFEPAPNTAMDIRLACDRARSTLGFRPQHTLDDGIREIRDLVASGGVDGVTSPRYSNEELLKAQPLTPAFVAAFVAASV